MLCSNKYFTEIYRDLPKFIDKLEVQDPVFARNITMEVSMQAMCIFNQYTKFCQSAAQYLALNFDATAYRSLAIIEAM